MAEGGALINLGELSKPATVLIEKVSDAVGGIAKPWQIKRVAAAEAEAAKIKAVAQIEISEIEERALTRMIREEGIKQRNIEAITAGAIPHLDDAAKPENIEDDWIAHFFEKSRLVSNQEMQTLWSKILADEANKPNTFTKRTLDIVSVMDKSDAELFTRFCSFVWQMGQLESILHMPWIQNDDSKLRRVTNFSDILHLSSIGLILYTSPEEYIYKISKLSTYRLRYYTLPFDLEFTDESKGKLLRGNVSLTAAGRELAPICGSKPNLDYLEAVLQRWWQNGVTISTPVESKPLWFRFEELRDAELIADKEKLAG